MCFLEYIVYDQYPKSDTSFFYCCIHSVNKQVDDNTING